MVEICSFSQDLILIFTFFPGSYGLSLKALKALKVQVWSQLIGH